MNPVNSFAFVEAVNSLAHRHKMEESLETSVSGLFHSELIGRAALWTLQSSQKCSL